MNELKGKTILFVTRKWPPAVGGMETYSREMATELDGLCNLTVLSLPGRHDGRPPSLISLFGFVLHVFTHLARRGRRYDGLLLGDLVLFPVAILSRLVAPRAQVIQTVHGTDVFLDQLPGWKARLYGLYLRVVRASSRAAHVVVANSRATAHHAERIGFHTIAIVPLGTRAPDGVTPEPPADYVLFVGRLVPVKGLGWFLREVLPRLPLDVHVKVAGTTVDSKEQRELSSPRTEFLGPVYGEELARLRRRALAVVVPNLASRGPYFEGFGLVATEAAGQGGLVLAANTGGITDAILDGRTGFLLPPEDPASWVAKIQEVRTWSQKRRNQFIHDAHRTVCEEFNWRRVATTTLQVGFDSIP